MRLDDWGEEGILAYLAQLLGGEHTPQWAEVGVGDDCAVFRSPSGEGPLWVATADAMVEGVHFLPEHPPDSLARRLLAANLSDVAAMAARPRVALLTWSAPAETPRAWIEAFMTALRDECQQQETWLAGGDVTRADAVCLNLFLLGEATDAGVMRMDGGRPGDDLWVTGTLGDSALGLELWRRRIDDPRASGPIRTYLEGTHCWREMLEICRAVELSAATDISDGLAVDLPRLCRAAGCAASVEYAQVPDCEYFNDLTSLVGCDRLTVQLGGGEDFQLLLTASAGERENLRAFSQTTSVKLTRIGALESGEPGQVRWLDENQNERELDAAGYDHYRGTL